MTPTPLDTSSGHEVAPFPNSVTGLLDEGIASSVLPDDNRRPICCHPFRKICIACGARQQIDGSLPCGHDDYN